VKVRRAFLLAHQWVGLAAAAFLVVIAVSGSALVFENEIDRALNPALSYVPNPDGRLRPLPLEELVARLNAERPDDPVGGVRIADRSDQAYEFSSRLRRSTFVDPYLGRVLGSRDREKSLARWLHLLHTRFNAGDIGEQMVGWFSVAMLGLATSGLVLWWPRKIAALRSSSSWKRLNFDLHNVLGVYSWLVIVAITLSGVLIAFEARTDPLVRRLNAAPEPPAPRLANPTCPPARTHARTPYRASMSLWGGGCRDAAFCCGGQREFVLGRFNGKVRPHARSSVR
jgi:uncharacterized iron-regulated membrane protein